MAVLRKMFAFPGLQLAGPFDGVGKVELRLSILNCSVGDLRSWDNKVRLAPGSFSGPSPAWGIATSVAASLCKVGLQVLPP